jgi:hypothetical protein
LFELAEGSNLGEKRRNNVAGSETDICVCCSAITACSERHPDWFNVRDREKGRDGEEYGRTERRR